MPDGAAACAAAVRHVAEVAEVGDPEVARDVVLEGVLQRELDGPIDVLRRQPGVVKRGLDGFERDRLLGPADVLAELGLADADDGSSIAQGITSWSWGRKAFSRSPDARVNKEVKKRTLRQDTGSAR
ncbi:MAG: hypothetical protein ACXVQ6_13280 [Actinomycetota bacterium]